MNKNLLDSADITDFLKLGFTQQCEDSGLNAEFRLQTSRFKIEIDCDFDMKLFRVNPDTDGITLQINDLNDLENLVCWVADEPIHSIETDTVGEALCGCPQQEDEENEYLTYEMIYQPSKVQILAKMNDGTERAIQPGDILTYQSHSGYTLPSGYYLITWNSYTASMGFIYAGSVSLYNISEIDEPITDFFKHCAWVGNAACRPDLLELFN